MEEQRIVYATAKLAKEKGFNELVNALFNKDGVLTEQNQSNNISFKDWNNPIGRQGKCYCSAPTQALLQRWLREKYDLHLAIDIGLTGYFCLLKGKNKGSSLYYNIWIHNDDNPCSSYEEALETGLYRVVFSYCLCFF